MNYFKLEFVQEALRLDYGAERVSVAAKPRVEIWSRRTEDHDCHALLAWERGEEILSEEEVRAAAEALRINARELIKNIRGRGGLWLGPHPP